MRRGGLARPEPPRQLSAQECIEDSILTSARIAARSLGIRWQDPERRGARAALARQATARFDRVAELTVGALMRETMSYGGALDVIASTSVPSSIYEDDSGAARR